MPEQVGDDEGDIVFLHYVMEVEGGTNSERRRKEENDAEDGVRGGTGGARKGRRVV